MDVSKFRTLAFRIFVKQPIWLVFYVLYGKYYYNARLVNHIRLTLEKETAQKS